MIFNFFWPAMYTMLAIFLGIMIHSWHRSSATKELRKRKYTMYALLFLCIFMIFWNLAAIGFFN